MTPDFLALGAIWYIVFLFSTTCHEGAHSLASHWGGDSTAFHGGQVTLNPIPHIRREPVGMIRVPGLSEWLEDIPVLVQHFLKKYGQAYGKRFKGLTRRAQIAMIQHYWPGNVREIENVISSAAITATADFIDLGDLPEHLQRPHHILGSPRSDWRPLPLNEVRREHIQRVLEMCNGNRVRASQVLGIGRTSLYRFLKRTAKRAPAVSARASA